MSIIQLSVDLLEAYDSAGNAELKAQEIRSNVLERVLKADLFTDSKLTEFFSGLLKKASDTDDISHLTSIGELRKMLRLGMNKELIWETAS